MSDDQGYEPASGYSDEYAEPIEHPHRADEIIVRIELIGGFVTLATLLTRVPSFSLFGDGFVVTEGPQIAIFPPPALPNLRAARVSEEGIQAILRHARDAGLFTNRTFPNPNVADVPTTVFTVMANGESYRVAAEGLGVGDVDEDRQKLLDFQQALSDLEGLLGSELIESDLEFQIERLQIVVQRPSPQEEPPEIEPDVEPWPLDQPLAEFGDEFSGAGLTDARCGVVEGDEVEVVVAALRAANQATLWESQGEQFRVFPRPLLPDEQGCRDPVAG